MTKVRHATFELVFAMRGELGGGNGRACGATFHGELGNPVFAWLPDQQSNALRNRDEDKDEVTCPRCIELMNEARGPVRDAELRVRLDEVMEEIAALNQQQAEGLKSRDGFDQEAYQRTLIVAAMARLGFIR